MVTDSTGAVIPGAQITIVNALTGVEAKAETRINGVFQMPNVPAGDYNIVAEAEGFKRAAVNGLRLNVASEISQSFALEIGAITEMVEVSAEQLQLQTTSGSVGSTVATERIQELPLPNRDISNLVNLVPGAFRSESNGNLSIGVGGALARPVPSSTVSTTLAAGWECRMSRWPRRSTPCRSSRSRSTRWAPSTAGVRPASCRR